MKTLILNFSICLQLTLFPVMGAAQSISGTEQAPTIQVAEKGEDTYESVGTGSDDGLSTLINGALMTGSATIAPGLLTCSEYQSGSVASMDAEGNLTNTAMNMKGADVLTYALGPVLKLSVIKDVGIVTSMSRPNIIPTFSHYIFMGGAVTLLASEIQGAILHKKFMEQQEKEVERMQAAVSGKEILGAAEKDSQKKALVTKEQKDAQMEALRIALQGEIHHKNLLQKRLNWLKAVEVVYWLSVAGATTETILYALTQVKPYGESIGYHNWKMTCNSSQLTAITSAGLVAAYKVIPSAVKGDWKGAGMGAVGAGISYFALGQGQNFISKMVDKGINLAMSSAPARIVGFGLFGGLSSLSRGQFSKKVDQTNKNISVLERSIADWKNTSQVNTQIDTTGGIGGGGSGDEGPGRGDFGGGNGDIKNLATGSAPKNPCIGQSGIDNKCKNPFKFSSSQFDLKNAYLNGVANDAMKMATAAANGDMASAEVMASGLAAQAARVKKETQALMAKAQETIKGHSGEEINFEKEINNALQAMTQQAANDLKSNGIGNGIIPNDQAKLAEDKKSNDESEIEVKTAGAGAAAADSGKAKSLDFGLNFDSETENVVAASAGKEAQSFDEFETTVEDISKKSDVSIFRQLSNRYLLNYTKIFEENKKKEIQN